MGKPARPESVLSGLDLLAGAAQPDAQGASLGLSEAPEGALLSRGGGLLAGDVCPHCRYGVLRPDPSFAGPDCEFFLHCPACDAHICTYVPMPHQASFHLDPHPYKMYAGGFGSAKTYTCGMEFLAHVLQIPNDAGLMGAATWGQASSTCLKFVTENLPKALVARSSQDKVNWNLQLLNGSRIDAKAFDDEGKIRSANLGIIWVEEASEVSWELVAYIMARLRNRSADTFKGRSRLKMLLSTNPDVGWPRDEWLFKSGSIVAHGDVAGEYRVNPKIADPARCTHLAATSANVYLPKDYEANLARSHPAWWVRRYLKCSFEYSEGLVYPDFDSWFEDPFPIPASWPRVTGTDFGRNDPTAHLVAAVDPRNKVVHVYGEVEETLADRDVSWIIGLIKSCDGDIASNLLFPNQGDPRGRNRDQVSGQSWFDAYRQAGYVMVEAKDCGRDSIAPTIAKVSEYAQAGRLRFFRTCDKLHSELSRYKYKPRKLGDDANMGEQPMDRNNHLPDALRYLLSPFPAFPEDPLSFNDVWREAMAQARKPAGSPDWALDLADSAEVVDMLDNFG